jgi:hypothetical protein
MTNSIWKTLHILEMQINKKTKQNIQFRETCYEMTRRSYHALFPADWRGSNLCCSFIMEGKRFYKLCLFKVRVGFKVLQMIKKRIKNYSINPTTTKRCQLIPFKQRKDSRISYSCKTVQAGDGE